MLELRIINAGQAMPLYDLPAFLGPRQAARQIGDTIEGLIAYLDDLGGDPDLEDSETGSGAVDAFGRYIGDTTYLDAQDEDREPDDDAQGDMSWSEWHTRGRHKLTAFGAEGPTHSLAGWQLSEDDEDDDPVEANGDELDTNNAEDETLTGGVTRWTSGPGCVVSDAGDFDDGI